MNELKLKIMKKNILKINIVILLTLLVSLASCKDFLEAGKKRLQGDTVREATSSEVVDLRKENDQLKALVAELSLKTRVLKKTLSGLESEYEEQ